MLFPFVPGGNKSVIVTVIAPVVYGEVKVPLLEDPQLPVVPSVNVQEELHLFQSEFKLKDRVPPSGIG